MSIILKRLTPYIVSILTFFFLELALAKPDKGWLFLAITLLFGLAGLFFVAGSKLDKKNFRLILPGLLFLISFTSFFLLLTLASSLFKHFFAVLTAVLLGIVLEIFFYLYNYEKSPRHYSNFFSYLNLLIIFMIFSSLGSASTFLNLNNALLFLISILISIIVFYSGYYTVSFLREEDGNNLTGILNQKIENLITQDKAQKILYTLIPALVLVEIFWSLSFLPTNFYINSFIITVSYYIISGLIKNRLNNNLSKKVIRKYLLIGGLCLLLAISTARI